jgi:nicotinamidase-related amidase
MKTSSMFASAALALGLIAAPSFAAPVAAQAVTDEWNTVKVPDAPEVKAVTVDPKTTALLIMDFNKSACVTERRPRCVTALPRIAKVLAAARDHKVPVIFTVYDPDASAVATALTPRADETVIAKTNPDKFLTGTADLQKILKDKGITTVIMAGTAANGALLQTATEGALRGFKVIVLVDGMPGDSTFIEAYTVYDLTHAPGVAASTTLTKSDMVSFGP